MFSSSTSQSSPSQSPDLFNETAPAHQNMAGTIPKPITNGSRTHPTRKQPTITRRQHTKDPAEHFFGFEINRPFPIMAPLYRPGEVCNGQCFSDPAGCSGASSSSDDPLMRVYNEHYMRLLAEWEPQTLWSAYLLHYVDVRKDEGCNNVDEAGRPVHHQSCISVDLTDPIIEAVGSHASSSSSYVVRMDKGKRSVGSLTSFSSLHHDRLDTSSCRVTLAYTADTHTARRSPRRHAETSRSIDDDSTDEVESGCEAIDDCSTEILGSSDSRIFKDLSQREQPTGSEIEAKLTNREGTKREREEVEGSAAESTAEGRKNVDSYIKGKEEADNGPNIGHTAKGLIIAAKKVDDVATIAGDAAMQMIAVSLTPSSDSNPEDVVDGYRSTSPMRYKPLSSSEGASEDTGPAKFPDEETPLLSNYLSSTPGSGLETFPQYNKMRELVGEKKSCCMICGLCIFNWWVYLTGFDDGQYEELEEA
ncbi:MAG: hypothetical protein Q9209_004014 [Squamulea sp. 1 TL-2023]